jgi:multidrug/hemolysin transport system permease protein
MKTLIKRNIKIYFRDKTNVFFSMLAILIMIVLFALFLGHGDFGSTAIKDTWLMAGVLSVAAITTSLGGFDVFITDRVNKVAKGFYASPVKRSHITAAYIASPFIAGVIMTTLTAIGFGIYIAATGGDMPGTTGLLQLAGLILLSNLTGTAICTNLAKSSQLQNTFCFQSFLC